MNTALDARTLEAVSDLLSRITKLMETAADRVNENATYMDGLRDSHEMVRRMLVGSLRRTFEES